MLLTTCTILCIFRFIGTLDICPPQYNVTRMSSLKNKKGELLEEEVIHILSHSACIMVFNLELAVLIIVCSVKYAEKYISICVAVPIIVHAQIIVEL